MKRMILITLVFVVILCGMVSKAHAQQFTISIDTIAVVLPPEEGVICHYHDIIPLSNVVKHHGYYFLKLDVRCEDRNKPSRYGDDITWWDGSILVAVSEDGSSARRIELPSEFDKALSSSYDMFVRDDIVWIKSVEKYDYRYWPMDIHSGYSLDETTWTWHYEKEVSDVAYEDDRYWVKGQYGELFVEKQVTFEANTSNGGLQMEPVNKQYKRFGKPIRILKAGGKYYFVDYYQIRVLNENSQPGERVRRTNLALNPVYTDLHYFRAQQEISEDYDEETTVLYNMRTNTRYYFNNGGYDTIIVGAFCVNEKIYTLVSGYQNIFIAQVDGNKLIPVVDFEQPMCRDRIVRPTSFINQLSMSPNRCLLKFVSSNQKDCGVLDIEDTTVKIHYFYLANNDGYGLVE